MSDTVRVDMTGEPLFETGTLSATSGFMKSIGHEDIATTIMVNCLQRHLAGDFGETCIEDAQKNMRSIKAKLGTIQSTYQVNTVKGLIKIYMITDVAQSTTTILLPSEY